MSLFVASVAVVRDIYGSEIGENQQNMRKESILIKKTITDCGLQVKKRGGCSELGTGLFSGCKF